MRFNEDIINPETEKPGIHPEDLSLEIWYQEWLKQEDDKLEFGESVPIKSYSLQPTKNLH